MLSEVKHLSDITVEELKEALDGVEGKTPAQRLIAAIAYKNGVTQSELARWFDVERKTIYNWLTRLEVRDLPAAAHDDHRPGRPRKLTDEQLDELADLLREPPTETGYDVPAWTTALVQRLVRDRFGIEYSRPSCRRLLKEAGLRHRTTRRAAIEVDQGARGTIERETRELVHIWLPR